MNSFTRRIRGFEEVATMHKVHVTYGDAKTEIDGFMMQKPICPVIQLPQRGTKMSAGYDLHTPISFIIEPRGEFKLYFDVKAYMLGDEVLELYLRSSVAHNNSLIIKNIVPIIDADYYSNEMNDGNIAVVLKNTGAKKIHFKAGERLVQGVFQKYLTIDNDSPRSENRLGESGSTGR
jgi:dUTP pyrophosphatase